MDTTSQVGAAQIGAEQVGSGPGSLGIQPSGWTRQSVGTPHIAGTLPVSGFTRRAFGTPSVLLGSLAVAGFTRRAFGTAQFNIAVAGWTRRAFGFDLVQEPKTFEPLGWTRRAFGDGTHMAITGHPFEPTGFSRRAFGFTSVLDPLKLTHVFIAGVDRTDWVLLPIKRTVMVGGKGSATFQLSNNPNTGRADCRPSKLDKVVIFTGGTYRFFSGYVDSTSEQTWSATNLSVLTVNCLQQGTRLDRYFVQAYAPPIIDGQTTWLGTVLQYIAQQLEEAGIIRGWSGLPVAGGPVFSDEMKFDTVSASSALTTICQQVDMEWLVDQSDWLHLFGLDTLFGHPLGLGTAPYQILDDAGTAARWISMTVESGGTYANRIKVKNSRVVSGNSGAADPFLFSYVSREEDAGEIALHGPVESLVTLQDASFGQNGTTATNELARSVAPVKTVTIESRDEGWEPGQLLTIHTARPPINDTFLIEQVDSEELGKGNLQSGGRPAYYHHVIRASNAESGLQRRRSGVRWLAKLVEQAQAQPQDRVTTTMRFSLAETVEGITNPGLSVGVKGPPATIEKPGILRSVTLIFKSPPSTTTCVIDVLLNGVSVFSSGSEIAYPAGATTNLVAQTYVFANDPQPVAMGDVVTVEVLQADSDAMDGTLTIVTYG